MYNKFAAYQVADVLPESHFLDAMHQTVNHEDALDYMLPCLISTVTDLKLTIDFIVCFLNVLVRHTKYSQALTFIAKQNCFNTSLQHTELQLFCLKQILRRHA